MNLKSKKDYIEFAMFVLTAKHHGFNTVGEIDQALREVVGDDWQSLPIKYWGLRLRAAGITIDEENYGTFLGQLFGYLAARKSKRIK